MREAITANLLVLICLAAIPAGGAGLELDPPAMPSEALVGHPFVLTYRAHWQGGAEDFVVLPVEADPFEGGRFTVGTMGAYTREGVHAVEQQVAVVADAPGLLALPEVRVPYRASGPVDAEAPATYLVAPSMTIEVSEKHDTPVWVIPGVLLGVILTAAILVWWMRRGRGADTGAAQSPTERAQSLLHEAQRRRLDGDHYAFYQTLSEVMRRTGVVDDEGKALKEKLERRAREVGFQGAQPHDDELTGDYRDVERAVARWKEELGP